jgi:hypothetical protein
VDINSIHYIRMTSGYIFYNSPASVASIDKNVPRDRVTQFPHGLYKGQALNPSKCFPNRTVNGVGCQNYLRDPSLEYIIGGPDVKSSSSIKVEHPPQFSRFGYGWCPNGYCTANHPGRYNTPPSMIPYTDQQPEDMAPARLYQGRQLDPFYSDSEAYITSRFSRDTR